MVNIQFITHTTKRYSYSEGANMALQGGCRWIQLRMKDYPESDIIKVARELQPLCIRYHAKFIIDDHVELAKYVHADGVHLGKEDMTVADARRMLGDEYLIGATANTFEDVHKHYIDGADYIGCGPFRFTETKKKLSSILGIDGYVSIVHKMKQNNLRIPIFAIGGITYNDIPILMNTGIDGIAVSGSILRSDSPVDEMRKWINQ